MYPPNDPEAKPLFAWLTADSEVGRLVQKAARIEQLNQLLRTAIDAPWATGLRLVNLSDRSAVIAVPSAAALTALRFHRAEVARAVATVAGRSDLRLEFKVLGTGSPTPLSGV